MLSRHPTPRPTPSFATSGPGQPLPLPLLLILQPCMAGAAQIGIEGLRLLTKCSIVCTPHLCQHTLFF